MLDNAASLSWFSYLLDLYRRRTRFLASNAVSPVSCMIDLADCTAVHKSLKLLLQAGAKPSSVFASNSAAVLKLASQSTTGPLSEESAACK